jgi:myosin regulatory light chain 12
MDELLSARPGGHRKSFPGEGKSVSGERRINFTMFLTMMGERLFEFDTEAELVEAFSSFDEGDTGMVKVEEMRKWLSEVGERMDEREVSLWVRLRVVCSNWQIERLLKGPFTDRQGNFNYREWVKVLRVNGEDEDDG